MTANAIHTYKVFYSYALTERDELLFGELRKHLAYLQRQGLISGWSRSNVHAGQSLTEQVDIKLNESDIILLLISSDFIDSDVCYYEMERALERHKSRSAHVILVYLRPCDERFFDNAGFSTVQILPSTRKHIDNIFPYFRDKAFAKVVQGIYKVIEAQSPTPQALPRLIVLR